MAIIKTLRYPFRSAAMFEDPIPGSKYIYFQNDAYDKDALSPVFDAGIIWSSDGTLTTAKTFGRPIGTIDTGDGLGGILILNGECTHVRHRIFNTNNDYRNTLDHAPFASMDPARRCLSSTYWTDGYSNMVLASYNYHDPTTRSDQYYLYFNTPYFLKINTNSRDLATSNILTNIGSNFYFAHQAQNGVGQMSWPMYRNPATNSLVWFTVAAYGLNNASAYGYVPYALNGGSTYPPFSGAPTQQGTGFSAQSRSNQFLGVSYRDGYTLTFQNYVVNDYSQIINKYIDNPGNQSTINHFFNTTVPFASGFGGTGTYYVSTNTSLTMMQNNANPLIIPMTATLTATVVGSISGSVLTVSAVSGGTFRVGQMISGSGVAATTTVTSVISADAQGVGTYNLSLGTGNASPGTTISAILTCTIAGSIFNGHSQSGAQKLNQLVVQEFRPITPGGRLWPGMTLTTSSQILNSTIINFTTATSGWNTTTNKGFDKTTNPAGSTYGAGTSRYSSMTFPCPTDPAGVRAWYTPFVDVAGNFQPFYFQWTTATEVISRSANVTVNYATGTTFLNNIWYPDMFSGTSVDVQHGGQRVWYNETFLTSTGTRNLIFMQLHGAGGVYDTTSTYRTFPIYTINPNDPLVLTYANSMVVPATPKNIVWLRDDRTQFAVITHNTTFVYTYFTTATNFLLTSTFPYQFNAVGRDNYNRVWAHDVGPLGYGRIHLLSGVPSNITVTASSSTYSYSGSTSTATFSIDAWDLSNARLTATINLSVIGSNLQLLNTSGQYVSTLTVVTSTSSSTIVTGQIIGSGYSSISASVTI
jgi:hypothetical protein